MTSKSTWRLLLAVDRTPQKMLSVAVTRKGDLIINVRPSPFYHTVDDQGPIAPNDDGLHGKKVIEQRYSIHPTRDSFVVNVLKQTIKFEDGLRLETWHFTKAIKSRSGFSPLFIKMAGSYQDRVEDDSVIEGHILSNITSSITIVFCIYVSHISRSFDEDIIYQDDFSVFQKAIGDYRLVVLWSFLTMRPIYLSLLTHFLTSDAPELPLEVQDEISLLSNGFTELEAIAFFKDQRDLLRKRYLREVEMQFTEFGNFDATRVTKMLKDFANFPYLKEGDFASARKIS